MILIARHSPFCFLFTIKISLIAKLFSLLHFIKDDNVPVCNLFSCKNFRYFVVQSVISHSNRFPSSIALMLRFSKVFFFFLFVTRLNISISFQSVFRQLRYGL